MSNKDHSLEQAINDPRKAVSADDQVALSSDQWTAMRGDAKRIGGSAIGAAMKAIDGEDGHLVIDALKHSGLGRISDRELTEDEKQSVITSAVRGAESVKDLIDIKRLERTLDAEHRGYIDCFPNFHDRVKDEDRPDFSGKSGKVGGELSIGSGIAGHEIKGVDEGIFLPPVDSGDRPIGFVPANRFDPRNPGVPTDTWGQK